jgi:hypothetical protein
MKIEIKETPEQLELVRAMASKNRDVAYEAQAAVATLMGDVINQVINNAPTVSNLYKTMAFGENDNPSIQLDLFYDVTDQDHIKVWQQEVSGGLAYSQLFPTHSELKFSTYSLDSAFAVDKKYVRRSRLEPISRIFTRMAQEVLLKQETNSVTEMFVALINAATSVAGSSATGNHVIGSTTENVFSLDDFNRLITRSKRINASFSGGTPVGGSKVGVNNLLVSPEMIQELRSMAYQPVNTRTGAITTSGATSIAAPESLREALFSSAGIPNFYGINIIEILELGIGGRYNTLFGVLDSGTNIVGGGNSGTFSSSADEILVGIDTTRESLIRPVIREEGTSSEFQIMVDDQFTSRSGKLGWVGQVTEGRIVIEDRALSGLVC